MLAAISASSVAFFLQRGWALYYGDAAAHINIGRRILDSRTPGWEQVGTVWLPLPHLLMLPFVHVDEWWKNGLGGSIPSAICFVIGGVFLFLAARRAFGDGAAGAVAPLLVALNPNMLYLQSIPMTEAAFLACLSGILYFTVRYRETQGWGSVAGAGIAAMAGTMTRYEGWFLLPFIALYFLAAAGERRWKVALVFCAIAGIFPLVWLVHNQIIYDNPLEFYNGTSSAKGIYQRALNAGMGRYPGDHDWRNACRYFGAAIRLCSGWPLVIVGLLGAVVALARRALWPLVLLALVPAFYVLSMHSGGTPIFVPHLWPHSYYNTRYGLAAMPLLAFAGAALVTLAPQSLRKAAAVVVLLAAVAPWLSYPRHEGWITWKESQVNSEARRTWASEAADYLRANYHRGDGIATSFGDMIAIFQQAGIPIRELYHDGNGKAWKRLMESPNPEIREKWAVVMSGDKVARAIGRIRKPVARYDLVKSISVKGAPVIEIYHRQP